LGKVVALNYRESRWPEGKTVPYQVLLFDGRLIFVPLDVPQLCKKYVEPLWQRAVGKADMQKLTDAISKGCEEEDHLGRTPLLACVDKGWQEGALLLLSKRADPCRSAGPEKCTALHLAVLPLTIVSFQDSDMDSVVFSRDEGVINAKSERPGTLEDNIIGERVSSISYDELDGQLSWVTDPDEGLLSAK